MCGWHRFRWRTFTGCAIAGAEYALTLDRDFRWVRSSLRSTTGCGVIAFAGYGIDAPEYGYNDFAGVDLKGKVAIILPREPQANDPNSKFMGVRADRYLDIGGWADLKTAEDHDLWGRLKRTGVCLLSSARLQVITSGRRVGRAPSGFAGALAAHNETVLAG
jgi:hypothetical protein